MRIFAAKFARPFRVLSLVLCALSPPLLAHDDDPKILDHQGPYVGPGYRPAAWIAAAQGNGMGALQSLSTGSSALLSSLDDNHLEFESSGVELLSWLPLSELHADAHSGNDIWGYVSPSGREYAIIGLSNGTAFVEITQPSDPVLIQHISGPTSLWRDVKTYSNYAYIVSEGGGGIQVVNLSQIDAGIVNHTNTVSSGGTSSTHNVAIDEESGYLYRCGGATGTGLRIYNLASPGNPSYVGSWNQRYVHDVEVVRYTSGPYAGRQIAFACSGYGNGSIQTGLTILDVTNKSSITVRAQFQYPGSEYSHQAWLSPDRQFLYLNDELDENGYLPTTTHVIDVSNIDSPFEAGTFTNGNNSIGHNLYTKGDQVFEANYRSGLRIFDVSAAPAGTEVAFFDTFPADDTANFNGLWGCYPYFPSGTVIGSDLERGLFVFWIGEPKLSFELIAGAPAMISPDGGNATVRILEDTPGDLQPGSARLYYDAGSGLIESPLVPLGGDLYQAQFPALTCLTEVKWFVAARSTDGNLWSYPKEAPYNNLDSLVAYGEATAFNDDMEQDLGWTVGAVDDDAVHGQWLRAVPVHTYAAPEEDHSPNGDLCWITGLTDDVDGGTTTLTSPVFDVQGWDDPILDFWLWFENRGYFSPIDAVRIEIREGNSGWNLIERIENSTITTSSIWRHMQYNLKDWVPLSADVQVRFRARDGDLDSRVEAGIDDFKIREGVCSCGAANYCTAGMNSAGSSALISTSGSVSISQNDFVLNVSGAVPGNAGLFFYGLNQTLVPLAEGSLCVAGGSVGIQRLQPPVQLDGLGSASRAVDFGSLPTLPSEGGITPGSTWNFQFWYRDPAGGPGGSNLSDGLQVIFCL